MHLLLARHRFHYFIFLDQLEPSLDWGSVADLPLADKLHSSDTLASKKHSQQRIEKPGSIASAVFSRILPDDGSQIERLALNG
jgi:hypothetical protein